MKLPASILLFSILSLLFVCTVLAAEKRSDVKPPMAKVKPKKLENHGHVRTDNYYWLKERENPEVIDYLNAENDYTDAVMAHTKDLQDELFEEIKGRIKQDDSSVPYKLEDYFYYTRYETGKEYPLYCRKKGSLEGTEEIMLNVNKMAEGHDYFAVRGRKVSWNQDLLAFAADTVGRRIYALQFKNLTTGEILPDMIPAVTGNMAWANDNKTLFYAKQDPATLRSFQIYKHTLGTDSATDPLVYEEKDDTFRCYVSRTKSKKYIVIGSSQTLSNEYRYLDAHNPEGEFSIFMPREREHEYNIDHYGDHFYIRTNLNAKNFRLMKTPVAKTAKENWREVIAHRDDVFLQNFEMFNDHLVVGERKDGLRQIRVISWDGSDDHYLNFGEPAYLAYVSTNPDFNTTTLRYGYQSMTTPNSIYDYDMISKKKVLLKQDEVLGDFSSENYVTERFYATAHDGAKVPISIVYRKGIKMDGSNPLLLYGYGSYGNSIDASFNSARLSLLDRSFIFAIAHIRGGQEMGRQWYDDGKLFKKKNTFTDFIDCGKYLVKEKYTSSDKLFCYGGSAGGLLIGAVLNMAPELFYGAAAAVPFVDVVTTMLDDSIPLTTSEYDEWGNPNEKDSYDYMLSYSPYDQVEAKNYPHLLVTTGLHDSQVQYWEPAKWVAKLRALKTGNNRLLLKTNMEAGHGGASGRFKRYKEIAFRYAFFLDLAGKNKTKQGTN
ncbi:S9 family peptidase [candidate division KSB1 bacterium]|nr:S9 family peptidase [candidate division KSB1 bacterium]